jgi:hypothetical protein
MIYTQLIGLFFLLTMMTVSYGQSDAKKVNSIGKTSQQNTLVGTWKLIEFADLDSATGQWKYRYGRNPKGYFTYTNSGVVSLNISSEIPLKMSEDSTKRYSTTLFDIIDKSGVGYFGTYTADWGKSIVTHHVTGGTIPNYIDTDQQRPFILKGDTLIIGDNTTWKRVLVRVD